MTNGEKLQKIFSTMRINVMASYVQVMGVNYEFNNLYPLDWWNAEYQESTPKNDLALISTWGLDEEIRCTMCTNSIKSDRGCDGGCVVNNAMYKNVMDAIERRIQPTPKNDLGVDAISRAEVLKLMQDNWHTHNGDWAMQESMDDIRALPSVTPQEPKPMVEIDLYSVIKQKYIEREVLDKIRAEIEQTRKMYLEMNDIDWLNGCDYVLSVIDKYKGESEET